MENASDKNPKAAYELYDFSQIFADTVTVVQEIDRQEDGPYTRDTAHYKIYQEKAHLPLFPAVSKQYHDGNPQTIQPHKYGSHVTFLAPGEAQSVLETSRNPLRTDRSTGKRSIVVNFDGVAEVMRDTRRNRRKLEKRNIRPQDLLSN